MKGIQYKDTFAAKGSALHAALEAKNMALAKAIYDDTTKRFYATYGASFKENKQ